MRKNPLPQHPPQPSKTAAKVGFANFIRDISRFYTLESHKDKDGKTVFSAKEQFRDFNRAAPSKKAGRYPKPVEQCVQMAYVQNNNNKQFRSILVVDIDDADLDKGEDSKTLQNIHYLCHHGLTPNVMILNPLNKKSVHLQFYIQRRAPNGEILHKNLHEQERFDALVQRLNILFHGDFQNRSLSIKNPFSDLYLNSACVLRESYWQLDELADMSLFVYNHKFTKGRICFTAVYNAHNKKPFTQAARKYFTRWDSEFGNPFFINRQQTQTMGNPHSLSDSAVLFFDKTRLNHALSPMLYAQLDDKTLLQSLVDNHASRNVGLFRFLCKRTAEFIMQGKAADIHAELCMRGRSPTLEQFIRACAANADGLNLPERELRSILNSVRRYAQVQYVPQALNRQMGQGGWDSYRMNMDTLLSEEEQNYKSSPFTIKDVKAYFSEMTQKLTERYEREREMKARWEREYCSDLLQTLKLQGICPPVLFDEEGFPVWLSRKGFNRFYKEYCLKGLGNISRADAKLLAKYLYEHAACEEQRQLAARKLQEWKDEAAKKRLEKQFQTLGERLERYYTYQYLPDFACDAHANGLAESPLLAFVKHLWETVYCTQEDLDDYRWRTLSYRERKSEIRNGFQKGIAQVLRDDMKQHPERYKCLFKNPEHFDKGMPSKYRLDYQVFADDFSLAHSLDKGHDLNTRLLPVNPQACEQYENVYQYLKVEQAIQHFSDLRHLRHGQQTYDNLFVRTHDTEERMLAKIFYQDKNKKHDRFWKLRLRKSEVDNRLYRDDFHILKGDFALVKKFLSLNLKSKTDLYRHKLHQVHTGLVQLFESLSIPHVSHFQFSH